MKNSVIIKGLLMIVAALVLNFYFFSIELRFMPSINTKINSSLNFPGPKRPWQ